MKNSYIKAAVTTFIIMSVGAMIACGGAEERKSSYLNKAKVSIQQGDHKKAKIDLKNVMQIDPLHSEAFYLMGTVEEKLGNYRKAFPLYAKAVELDENNVAARYSLGKFYLRLKKLEEAKKEAAAINNIQVGSDLEKGLLAGIAYHNEKHNEAIEIIDSISPKDREVDLYELQSVSYYTIKNTEAAIETLKLGISHHSNSAVLYKLLAKIYSKENNVQLAAEQLTKLIELDPANVTNYIVLSNLYIRHDDKENAEGVYNSLVDRYPDVDEYKILFARYIAKHKSLSESMDYLSSLILQDPENETYKITLAKLNINFGNDNLGETRKILNEIIKSNLTSKGVADAKNVLAEVNIREQNFDDAEALLSEILDTNPGNVSANFTKGKILLSKNKYGDAVNAFRVVINETPKNGEAYLYLASAHEALGDKELAFDVLSNGVLETQSNINLIKKYMSELIARDQKEYALNFFEKIRLNIADPYNANNLYGELLLANEKHMDAKVVGDQLIESHPEKEGGYKILAQYNLLMKDLPNTSAISKIGYEKSKSSSLLVAYVRSELVQGNQESIIKYLSNNDDHKIISHKLLGDIYVTNNELDDSVAMYKKTIEYNKEWDMPYASLVAVYIKQKKYDDAINTCNDAIKNIRNNMKFRFIKAQTFHTMGRLDDSIRIYESMLNVDGNNAIAANNLAQLLVDEYDDKASIDKAYKLIQNIKSNPNIAFRDTTGWVLAKYGSYDEAITILRSLVSEKPGTTIFNYHLGMAYYYKGDNEKALPILTEVVEKSKDEKILLNTKSALEKIKATPVDAAS